MSSQNNQSTAYSSTRQKMPDDTAGTRLKRFLGYYPKTGAVPLENTDRDKPITTDNTAIVPSQSFMSYVPFSHYDTQHQQMVTPNGERAVFLEILPADVEGLADNLIDDIGNKIALALQSLVGVDNPWVIQIYLNDEPVRALIHEIKAYSNQHSPASAYKKEWFKILENHLQILSAREGVFTERKSGLNWRARYRRVHMVIYRKTNKVEAESLNSQVLRLTESLNEAGIHSRRMTGKDVWTWLMPWLSGEHENAYNFMETLSYPEKQEANGELSETVDLGEMCLRNRSIQCSAEGKYWQLGNRYNRFITLEPYRGIPDTGHWVLEKQSGTTSFDRMPDGAVLMYTLVIDPQDQVEAQVIGVKTTSIGDGEEAKQTRKECKQTLKLMAQDNRLISCLSGIYIDATS
ncbi:MAG TPA: hypothetical protein EYG71_03175, partial [Leucothrix sp.]|nr:hypothetical protein [Leucothrix sp.]